MNNIHVYATANDHEDLEDSADRLDVTKILESILRSNFAVFRKSCSLPLLLQS